MAAATPHLWAVVWRFPPGQGDLHFAQLLAPPCGAGRVLRQADSPDAKGSHADEPSSSQDHQ